MHSYGYIFQAFREHLIECLLQVLIAPDKGASASKDVVLSPLKSTSDAILYLKHLQDNLEFKGDLIRHFMLCIIIINRG